MSHSALVHAVIWSTALFTIALLTPCRRVLCKFFPERHSNIKFVKRTRRGNEILLSFGRVRTYEDRKRRNLFYHIHMPRWLPLLQLTQGYDSVYNFFNLLTM